MTFARSFIPLTDELELGADVLHEERHVVGEVELGGGEDERVGQHGGAAQAVHLAAAQRTDRPAGQGCNSTDILETSQNFET